MPITSTTYTLEDITQLAVRDVIRNYDADAPRGESGLSAKDFDVSIRHRTHEDRMVELEIIVSRKVQR